MSPVSRALLTACPGLAWQLRAALLVSAGARSPQPPAPPLRCRAPFPSLQPPPPRQSPREKRQPPPLTARCSVCSVPRELPPGKDPGLGLGGPETQRRGAPPTPVGKGGQARQALCPAPHTHATEDPAASETGLWPVSKDLPGCSGPGPTPRLQARPEPSSVPRHRPHPTGLHFRRGLSNAPGTCTVTSQGDRVFADGLKGPSVRRSSWVSEPSQCPERELGRSAMRRGPRLG